MQLSIMMNQNQAEHAGFKTNFQENAQGKQKNHIIFNQESIMQASYLTLIFYYLEEKRTPCMVPKETQESVRDINKKLPSNPNHKSKI